MLKKELRLSRQFPRKANFFSTPFFDLKYTKNDKDVTRFGFVVSKKVDPGSVVRNRTKRLFRGIIERDLGSIVKGYELLFILKRKTVDEDIKKVEKSLIQALKDNNLWVKK